ncbi:MAG: alpha-amylase family glycosyl hydrolase [Bacillota bacterium]
MRRNNFLISTVLILILCLLTGLAIEVEAMSSEVKDKGDSNNKVSELAEAPDWSQDSVIYEVNVRQYTEEGTFEAFEEHLPRLKELGVEILWFMPIHPISEKKRKGRLGSYYAVQDYKAINPEFGTKEDFKRLVEKAHDMGFKVLLDWVANHTGWDNKWIENKSWYTQDEQGNIVHPPGTNWTDVADLNYENKEMRAAMIDAMEFWVAEVNIDGYRCDHAGGIPRGFWETARKELDKIKPVFMLAEDGSNYDLLEKAFNANYGWDINGIMKDIAAGKKSAPAVESYVKRAQRKYPGGSYPLLWTANHDDNSWHGTTEDLFGDAKETMAALTFTLPGMPLIYSGQEAGLDKQLEFFKKDQINWGDFSQQKFYQKLVDLKTEHQALWNGDAGGEINLLDSSKKSVLAFERKKGEDRIVVIMNLSDTDVTTTVKTGSTAGRYKVYFSNLDLDLKEEHNFELEAWEYHILVQQ